MAQVKDYDPKTQGETYPPGDIITFEFAAKGSRRPVTLVWHSGTEKIPTPKELEPGRKGITTYDTGAYVYGDKGVIAYGSHGAEPVRIIPETAMKAYKLPPHKLPRVKNHYADWLRAIREGGKAGSDFSYGGPLAELAMLGIIALKHAGHEAPVGWAEHALHQLRRGEQVPYPDLSAGLEPVKIDDL